MSTIVTSNISDGTTSVGTSYVVNGSAKAWVNFNGTGTIAARDSLNLSSLTDNGTGTYTMSFTDHFSDTNYSSLYTGSHPSVGYWWNIGGLDRRTAHTTSSIRVVFVAPSSQNTFVDSGYVTGVVLGDLA
jgi:hypothetical protein